MGGTFQKYMGLGHSLADFQLYQQKGEGKSKCGAVQAVTFLYISQGMEVMNRRIMTENRLMLRKENSSEVCFFCVHKAFVSKTPKLLFLIGMRREKGVRTVHILLSALQNLILKEKSQKVMFVSPLTQNICICSHSTVLSDALV